mmetsp:Transcript_50775/g.164197  ORF Transcript_50775/g.164197 Transcript_50775/m.164197 type:complete len:210 (+) Transcript_50775:1035-1664(+)
MHGLAQALPPQPRPELDPERLHGLVVRLGLPLVQQLDGLVHQLDGLRTVLREGHAHGSHDDVRLIALQVRLVLGRDGRRRPFLVLPAPRRRRRGLEALGTQPREVRERLLLGLAQTGHARNDVLPLVLPQPLKHHQLVNVQHGQLSRLDSDVDVRQSDIRRHRVIELGAGQGRVSTQVLLNGFEALLVLLKAPIQQLRLLVAQADEVQV